MLQRYQTISRIALLAYWRNRATLILRLRLFFIMRSGEPWSGGHQLIQNAHQANKKLAKDGFPDFIKRLVEDKNDRCENWRNRFDKEFKVNFLLMTHTWTFQCRMTHIICEEIPMFWSPTFWRTRVTFWLQKFSGQLYQYRLWPRIFELGSRIWSYCYLCNVFVHSVAHYA